MTIIHLSSGRVRFCVAKSILVPILKTTVLFQIRSHFGIAAMGSQVCTKRISFWSLISLFPSKQPAALHKGNHKLLFYPGIPIQQKFLSFPNVDATLQHWGSFYFIFQWESGRGEKCVLRLPFAQKSCLWHVMLETGQGLRGISRAIHFLIRCPTLLIKISLLLPVSTKFFHKYLLRCQYACMRLLSHVSWPLFSHILPSICNPSEVTIVSSTI